MARARSGTSSAGFTLIELMIVVSILGLLAGISIFPPDALTAEELQKLDSVLDNGDINTGKFRMGTSGRPTYVIQEN